MAQRVSTAEARRRLAMHVDPDGDGFLGRLRRVGPERAAFDDLMDAVTTLSRTLRLAESLDRRLVRELWQVGFCARAWALDPAGRLVRTGRIDARQQAALARWIAAYEWAVAGWLDGEDDVTALALHRDL